MRELAAIIIIILSLSSPINAEYDPQHTMLALNMAIVSVNRILTAQSRAVLEQEYSNIINNLSLGNIESDSDMTALYRDLLSVISRKRVSDGDSRRLKSFYDRAEQRRIAYALSNVKITEAQISAMQNDISGLENESQTQISAAQNDIDSLKNESQAKISAAQNDIESIKRESQAEISAAQSRLETVKRTAQSQLRSSQNTLDEIRGDIRSINREKNALTYSWLGNMAVSCVSFFAGDVFSVGGMLWDTAMLYTERGILDKQQESAERNYRQQKSEHERLRAESERLTQEARGNLETVKAHQARLTQQAKDNLETLKAHQARLTQQAQDNLETLKAHQQRLIQQAQDNLEIQRVRLSRLNEEMKQDEAMLKEELKASLWQLERQDIAECAALQERLLTASWNLMRKYGLPDEYRITQISLKNFYRAVNEDDVSRRSRMLRNLEDEFRVYPPYWYYRAKTAQEAGNLTEARKYFAEFNKIWRPVLRRDPYKLEAEKFMIQDLASSGKAIDEIMPEISAHLETVYDNTPKDDWADNIFLGVAYFVLGEKNKGMDCIAVNLDFGYEDKISGMLFAQMEKGTLDSEEAQEVINRMKLSELIASMKISDGDTAMLAALFFEGKNDSLSANTNSPVIFHALRISEQMKGSGQDYAKVMEYVRRHDALKDKIQSAYTEIAPLVSKYADEGRENAKIFMADMLLYGWGIPQDVKKAEEIFTVLAENGNAYAQFVMIQRSLLPVMEAPKKESELKTPKDFYQAGRKYWYGEGVIMNNAKAAEYFTVAAENGHAEAQLYLATCYMLGHGVNEDLQKARYWYEKSAAQGNKLARDALDSLNKKTVKKKTYTKQELEAIFQEGYKYYTGYNVIMNNKKAVELFTIAAENGHSEAQRLLGICYRNGYGVSKDLQKARYWYQQAANQGNESACLQLDDLNRLGY